jgi:GntR family transcriptional regulator
MIGGGAPLVRFGEPPSPVTTALIVIATVEHVILQIDPTSSLPLYAQIAGQVRTAIADGSLSAGDRLPPARELAASLEVNMHTVLRAYQELRDERLVDMRRGRGVSVADAAPDRAPLVDLATRLIAEGRRRGLADHAIVATLTELM